MKTKLILACAAVASMSAAAHAGIFTDRAAFDAAYPGLFMLDFEGYAPEGGFIQPAPDFSAFGVTITDVNDDPATVAIADSGFAFGTPTDALFINVFDLALKMRFDPLVEAVGFDVAIGFGGLNATVNVYDGAELLESTTFDTEAEQEFRTFIGFGGYGDITHITVSPAAGGFVLIDNLAYGVPTPGALALLGLAGLTRRRRR